MSSSKITYTTQSVLDFSSIVLWRDVFSSAMIIAQAFVVKEIGYFTHFSFCRPPPLKGCPLILLLRTIYYANPVKLQTSIIFPLLVELAFLDIALRSSCCV